MARRTRRRRCFHSNQSAFADVAGSAYKRTSIGLLAHNFFNLAQSPRPLHEGVLPVRNAALAGARSGRLDQREQGWRVAGARLEIFSSVAGPWIVEPARAPGVARNDDLHRG